MTFFGHALPASFFFGFSFFVLCLTLHRVRKLPPGASLAQTVIPEPNVSILRWCGLVATICSILGVAYETAAGITHHHGNWTYHIVHQTLYLSFTFVGVVLLFESYHRLPPDSHRLALATAFVLEYVLWTEHANMKEDEPRMIHKLMGQICLVSAMTFVYSVWDQSSIIAYISGWALMILQSTWLFAAGFDDLPGHEMSMHKIGSTFCLHVLVIAFIIVLVSACVSKNDHIATNSEGDDEMETLNLTPDMRSSERELELQKIRKTQR